MSTPSHVELSRRLNGVLGPALVSVLAGSDDVRAAISWSEKGSSRPTPEVMMRLECAYAVWQKVSDAEGAYVARLWFMNSNPTLHSEATVINAIREGRFDDVQDAAQALANNTSAK